ncbi:MAG: protein kinase [Planctomycetota bacterium]
MPADDPAPTPRPKDAIAGGAAEDTHRYELSRMHSEGGLGRVWLAQDPAIGRDIALKELLSEQSLDPNARARFVSEAQITGQLEHPNIVPVYDVGERGHDGRPFYTMRFVRGPTLADAIHEEIQKANGKRSWSRRRARLVRAVCAIGNAISHAHERGIIHRDLKPENVVLGPHGELIVLDWGLAKRIQDAAADSDSKQPTPTPPELSQTAAGSVMGTIAYMSPEQAAGGRPDERTDVYGLGAILFEVLTGRAPHDGDDVVDVLRRIAACDSPRARTLAPEVPAQLDAICGKAMAKAPGDRYPTADAFLEDVERWLADEPVEALPDTVLRGLARWIRRHQVLVSMGTAAALLIGIVATLAAIQLGAAAERERSLRERSIQVSARLAARALGSEIDVRWSALNTAARSSELRDALRNAQRPEANGDQALQQWVAARFDEFQPTTDAVSWFVQDRQGVQRARAPYSSASVGKSYAFRDYFNGRGKDLPATTTNILPIEAPHLSAVFESEATHNLMVAFTVPIRAGKDADVIGVLGMTVELGHGLFRCLKELGLDDNQVAVLVETREDWTKTPGLVLQHPELVRSGKSTAGHVPLEYVEHFRTERAGMLRNYHDAIGDRYADTWLAAYEMVSPRRFDRDQTGWVVVIQERDSAP